MVPAPQIVIGEFWLYFLFNGERVRGGNMTSRMSFVYVALATSVLMTSDVVAARAATKFCDIYPERCQYDGSGINYYYPLGYRMPGETVAPSRNTRRRPATTARQTPATTARKTPTTIAREKPTADARGQTSGDGAQASRPGSN